MNFLTPSTIWIAAGLAIPPLVLLYFLKLRRQEMLISSTFFWKRAVQDLQVNAPFQRLRRNLLLLLQLLVMLLCALALGQPLLHRDEDHERSLILLMDCSASMNVVEADGRTRLERAKAEAGKLIDQMEEIDRAMIIAFNNRAQIMAPFSNNRAVLRAAFAEIKPTEGLSRLSEAIALAAAHAHTQIVETPGTPGVPVPTGPEARVVLLSDGRIEDSGEISLERLNVELINVAESGDNVGILALQASRHYEHPEQLNVVAAVENFGHEPVNVDVELFINGQHMGIQTVALAAASDAASGAPDSGFANSPSAAVVSFGGANDATLEFAGSGVLEVQLSRNDALPSDNRAVVLIPPPRYIEVLLVTPGNLLLSHAMAVVRANVTRMTPDEYEQASEEQIMQGGRARFDVVMFDGCTSQRLPTGSYFFWGAIPQVGGFGLGEPITFDSIYDWDDSHVVMRNVDPSNIEVAAYHKLILPENAEILMEGIQGSVLASVSHQGSRFLICAFSLLDGAREAPNTNWYVKESLVIFLINSLQYLAGALDVELAATTRPGDPLVIGAPHSAERVSIHRPDGTTEDVLVGSLDTAHYSRTDQIGVYEAAPTAEGSTRYAVNLFSPNESRIDPNDQLVVGGEALEARAGVQTVNVPFWPWLLLAALGFLLIEWIVYSRRILL